MIDQAHDISSCIAALRNGGAILFYSDTGVHLGCDATNFDAVAKLSSQSKKPIRDQLLVLVTEEQDVLKHVAAPDLAVFDFLKTCEGATAIRYEGVIGLADNLIGQDGGVNICITSDAFSRHLIKRFGKPIVCLPLSDLERAWARGVDHIVSSLGSDQASGAMIPVYRWQSGQAVPVRQ